MRGRSGFYLAFCVKKKGENWSGAWFICFVMRSCISYLLFQHGGMPFSKVLICVDYAGLCFLTIFIKHVSPTLFIFAKECQRGRLLEIFLIIILGKNNPHVFQ